MHTCSNCGATVREGARFCTACGTRLNDTVVASSTNAWSTSSDAGAGTSDRTNGDSNGGVSAITPTTKEQEADADADASAVTADAHPSPDGEFSWTWGDPVDDGSDKEQVTEDADATLDAKDHSSAESEGDDEPIVDASELGILEEDHTASDEGDAVAADSNHQNQAAVDDEDDDNRADNETLATWAEQWDESADESATTSTGANDNSTTAGVDDEDSSNDADGAGEDTVAKAERLFGELRAMMPALINPRPATPSSPDEATTVADDLETAARISQFDDVSEALLAARDNPRDVDNMLSLAGMVDRLLELLDDRNNLAKSAENAASRLRSTTRRTLM